MFDRCIRFSLGEQSWDFDLGAPTLNDRIVLQRMAGGRPWPQLLNAFDADDAEVIKVLFWAARRASGETIAYDDPEMNPRAVDLTTAVLPRDEPKDPAE